MITGHGDIALAVEAMKAGAVDFIEKPFDDEVLIGAIKTALAAGSRHARTRCTAAETRARLICRARTAGAGRAGRRQAQQDHRLRLDISPRTVEIYRANVMTKMQADSLSALVRMALLADRPPRRLALDQFALRRHG